MAESNRRGAMDAENLASDRPEFEPMRPKIEPVATHCKFATCRSVSWKNYTCFAWGGKGRRRFAPVTGVGGNFLFDLIWHRL